MKTNNAVSNSHRQNQPAFAAAFDAFGTVPHGNCNAHGKHLHHAARNIELNQPSFAAAFDNF